MKTLKISALLLLVLGASAYAADENKASVQLWGVADVNVGYLSDIPAPARSVTLGQGGMYGSRLGFKGNSASFGDGTQIIFSLEGDVDPTKGTLGGGNAMSFNRYAFVGIRGRMGTLRGGTMMKPYDDTAWNYEPLEAMGFSLGSVTSWRGFGSTGQTLRYDSPAWGGFKFSVFDSLGGTSRENHWGLLGTKSFGSVDTLAYYEVAKDKNGKMTQTLQGWNASTGSMFALLTRANLGAAKLYLGYNQFGAPDAAGIGAAPKKQTVWSVGASYQLNPEWNLKAGYYDLGNSADKSFGARTISLGAQYAWAANTTVYGLLGNISNGSNGTTDLTGASGALPAGHSQHGAKVGVMYIF
jgi:predicted porin